MIKLNRDLRELGIDEKNFYFSKGENNDIRYIPDEDTGIPPSHTWAMDGALAMIIYTYLRTFKDTKRCAYPARLTPEKWESILDEMIRGFASMIKEEESHNARKRQRKALMLFKNYFYDLGW